MYFYICSVVALSLTLWLQLPVGVGFLIGFLSGAIGIVIDNKRRGL